MSTSKILIVEDEPILALELTEDLNQAGYAVCGTVSDGDKVLPAVMQNRPDAILMDIKILGFRDGIEAAARVRGLLPVPIIYLTSKPYAEVSQRIAATQPAWYLEKPYDEAKLLATLKTVLQPA